MGLKYTPKQGDICYINFAPTKGHEQGGLRPAIIISKNQYNKFTNMAIICPISSNTKKFPTHYELKNTKKVKGSVLCEHLRSIDFEARKIKFIEEANILDLESIIDIISGIIEI